MSEFASAPHGAGGPPWTRRRIVVGVTAAPVLILAAPASGGGQAADQARRSLAGALRAIVGDLDAARALGQAYIGPRPGAVRGVMELAGALAAAVERGPAAVRRLVAKRRDRDRRAGEVVLVDGWVLARAEAEFCALALAG
jgi:hypothetical protein